MVWGTQGPVTFHLAKRRDSTRRQASWCALVSTLLVGNTLVDSKLVVSQDNQQLCKEHLQTLRAKVVQATGMGTGNQLSLVLILTVASILAQPLQISAALSVQSISYSTLLLSPNLIVCWYSPVLYQFTELPLVCLCVQDNQPRSHLEATVRSERTIYGQV